MAISKLKPRHASEGRSIAAALKDRLDYDKNPEKTDGGLLVTLSLIHIFRQRAEEIVMADLIYS